MEKAHGDDTNNTIRNFTRSEIERITEDYNSLIGRGAFGEVYEGVLNDGSMVAVKRLMHNVIENFHQELTVHRQINHRNVVRLIGYCQEEDELMMVTEYIHNGNLCNALHNDNISMALDTRLRIAMECAEALAYMHSYMYTHVIHGDIKPDNILLDDSICAKLSDFGISRLINTDSSVYTEHVIGSRGYMDPLFVRDGCLTVKSDVYSFGVVLLELITRKKPTTEDGKAGIVYLFTDALLKGPRGVRELFDVEISNQNNMKTLEGVAKLAGECLRMERDKRPEMIGVAERLRMLRKTLLQGQQQVDLFSWLRKSKSAPAAMASTTTISPSDVPTVTPTSSMTSSSQCRRFSHIKMKAATRNFDESLLVGEGEFGRVYRGEIDGGATMVAIKRLWSIQKKIKCLFYPPDDGGCEFRTIMEKRSKLCHRHIVPLIGYCNDNDQMMLVYKYMARGSLREQLFNTQKPPLTWIQRLEICIGAARGLDYLHRGADHDAIIHRNVKLSNILLDEEWDALISDNLETDTSEVFIGSNEPGAPLYVTSRHSQRTDVYYFCVVLFEVLCGRPHFDSSVPREQFNLVEWAARCREEGNLDRIVDPYLRGKITKECLNKFVETAEHSASMEAVVSGLERALGFQLNGEGSGSK